MLLHDHAADSVPGPAYTHFKIGILDITRAKFLPGMWQEMRFPECSGYADIDTVHAQPVGTMVDVAGILPPREPGWYSKEDFAPIGGVVRRMAISPTEVWCVRARDRQSSVAGVQLVRLAPGAEMELAAGTDILLIHGAVSIADKTVGSPRHLSIKSDALTVSALSDAQFFHWRG